MNFLPGSYFQKAKTTERMNTQLLVLLLALGTFVSASKRAREEKEDVELVSWDTLVKEQEKILDSAKKLLESEGERAALKQANGLITSCLLHGHDRVQRLTLKELTDILASIILVDYHGTDVPLGVSWENFTEGLQPLFLSPPKAFDFIFTFSARQDNFYHSNLNEDVRKRRQDKIDGMARQMISEGIIVDSTSSPVMDTGGKLCFNPSYIRQHELLELLNSAIEDIRIIKDDSIESKRIYDDNSRMVIKYAIDIDQKLPKMTTKDFEQILSFVVLCDHYGKFGGKNIPEEKLQKYLRPLLQDNGEEKRRNFLLKLCMRVCKKQYLDSIEQQLDEEDLDSDLKHDAFSELNDTIIPPQPRSVAEHSIEPLSEKHRAMIQSAIDFIREISNHPEESQKLHKELSSFATKCAVGTENQMETMSFDDTLKIIQLVVLREHSGNGFDLDKLSQFLSRYFFSCCSQEKLGWLRGYIHNY